MTRRCLVAVGVVLVALMLPSHPAAARAGFPGVHLLSSTPESVAIEFVLPAFSLQEMSAGGRSYVEVQVEGLSVCGEAGAPQLPCTGALLGVPPAGTAVVHILEEDTYRRPLVAPIWPVPVPLPARGGDRPGLVDYQVIPEPAIYGAEALYPRSVVELGEPGWVRSQRVARLAIRPVRYDPQRQELVLTRRLVVEVRFETVPAVAPGEQVGRDLGRGDSLAFDALLDNALINADVASGWRTDLARFERTAAKALLANGPANRAGSYKVWVEQDGFYRLTYADLQAAGLPVGTLDPRTLQLFEGDRELAVQVNGQQDGSFDPGDALVFYGRAPQSRYTGRNVYWLRYGDQAGRRMARRQISPSGQPSGVLWTKARWERDRYYDPMFAATDGDHWYAADLRPGEPGQARMALMVPGGGPAANLWVHLAGYTHSFDVNPDHHLVVRMNGQFLSDVRWDGKGALVHRLLVSADRLRTGENELTFSVPGDTGAAAEGVWLDALELDYVLQEVRGDQVLVWTQIGTRGHSLDGFTRQDLNLYDITDPRGPVELHGYGVTGSAGSFRLSWSDIVARSVRYYALTGAQFRHPAAIVRDQPSQLRSTANGADYVLIAHGDLMGAVRPLLNQRQLQGLRVASVDVQDVYDEFGGGLIDPEAIRAFVAYAYQHWSSPAPSYLLLVGDGHYDFLDHFGYGAPNYLPPYLAMVDPWWGETAADNRYAAVVGDDILPDLLVGRLPVSSLSEAETLVAKIVQYEREPFAGDWNARHAFVADRADRAGDFARAMDVTFETFIQDPWLGTKIYLDNLPFDTARREALAAWQSGALLISFMGHSSWHQWSIDSLLHVADVPALQNGRRLPVLLSMTCFTGFYHHPEYGTLDELLVRHRDGGAVASWSPSGLGLQAGHQRLHQSFYRAVVPGSRVEIGRAILEAKLELHTYTDDYDELLDTYHLFGDPAMALNTNLEPWPHLFYLPVMFRDSMGG